MKVTNKSLMFALEQEVKIGDLTATLVAQVFYNPDEKNVDIEYMDICNTKFRGIEIKGYDNWKKFKAFHLEMGIDYAQLTNNEFDKIFTESAVKKEIANLKIKF